VDERRTATLSCSGGATISAIQFASYGTPTGSCQTAFRTSSCHATSSADKVRAACLGKTSCTVEASNAVFSDPCLGTPKQLAVTYTCTTGGVDNCPNDPNKTAPGQCGCGVPEGSCGGDPTGRVKVFILSGQSNMVGQGVIKPTEAQVARNGGMGTLEYLVTKSPLARQFSGLGRPGAWTQRSDVWIVDLTKSGPLTAGYGSNQDHIGPELQFGHVLGDFYENPVLIIKAAWGGRSLYSDFRPPSAGGTVGPSYTLLVERVRQVLGNLKQYMPSYQGQGYDIAGFGWHQGWNDRINQTAVDSYQTNCVHLINDLRAALGAAEMPFVIGTTGMTGWTETHPRALALMKAQLAVPSDARVRRGKVSAVDTRDYWRDVAQSPADQGYHWNRNAETYVLIGNGMGQAMTKLMPPR
jgi:alpha-galactosidase